MPNIENFFRTHTQSLFATALLALITALLFGIFSQLQTPGTDTTPSGVTAVNYSTFVEQVKAGNVLAVAFQGDTIYGLPASPLGQERASMATPTASTPQERTAEIAVWTPSMVHTRHTPLLDEVCLGHLARVTTGMSGADLANLVNEAALCAARRDLDCLTQNCFEDALARVQLGALRPLLMSERERRIIAFHEGGHTLVAHHLP